MKICHLASRLLFLALFALSSAGLQAQTPKPIGGGSNAYDALGRALLPIAGIFLTKGEPQALSARLVLESMTGLPPALAGSSVDIAVQPPDRARVTLPWNGNVFSVTRVGQEIRIEPGSAFTALAGTPPEESKKKKKKKQQRPEGLPPIALPFPPQQLALLPILFQVTDQGTFNGLRVLDVQLMSELAKNLGVEEWTARLSLDMGSSDFPKINRIELARPGWRLVARVENLEKSRTLPETTWEPTSEDVVRLTGAEAQRWLNAATAPLREMKKR